MLFIRGELPIRDEKYDLKTHPNFKYTAEGSGQPYEHGSTKESIATISFATVHGTVLPNMEAYSYDYELLSNEEIETQLLNPGGNLNEESYNSR